MITFSITFNHATKYFVVSEVTEVPDFVDDAGNLSKAHEEHAAMACFPFYADAQAYVMIMGSLTKDLRFVFSTQAEADQQAAANAYGNGHGHDHSH
jgi:hypothetical protein